MSKGSVLFCANPGGHSLFRVASHVLVSDQLIVLWGAMEHAELHTDPALVRYQEGITDTWGVASLMALAQLFTYEAL